VWSLITLELDNHTGGKMGQRSLSVVPEYLSDDGGTITFQVTEKNDSWTVGFMHRPVRTQVPENGTLTPPITWADFDTLDNWTETLKYSARNKKAIQITFDDQLLVPVNWWSVEIDDVGGYGGTYTFNPLLQVTE
jgi:hypothetical protein